MSVFLRQFKHLLPHARAWNITIDKRLRQFFGGLVAGLLVPLRTFVDEIWFDMFPQNTREIAAWEWQFGLQNTGLTEQERRDRLDSTWKSLVGGQSPSYIQGVLRDHGFDVYLHEWWVPGSNPAIARDPTAPLLDMLVNKLFTVEQVFTALCGEPGVECGEVLAECGQYTGFTTNQVTFSTPTDPLKWPYILYIGAMTWPNVANVPSARREEFEDLCLKICPAQQWLGMSVSYGIAQLLDDGDMERSTPTVDFEAGATGQLMPDGDMEA